MAETKDLTSQVFIKIGGAEIERPVLQSLIEVVVDQHAHLPGMFTIRLHDPELKLLDEGPFDLTKEVKVSAEKTGGEKVLLIKGEVTALEPYFGEGMIAELVVRGYDRSHRLYRETKSKAYLNIKDSDLATEIAGKAGLQAQVDSTSAVYEHLYQHNQSDLAFLMQRAWRIGYECFVSGSTLYFRKPPSGGGGVSLKWGDDLLSFQPRMTLAEQVDEVVVRGWDVEKQTPIVGRAESGSLYPDIEEPKDGASWAKEGFGAGKLVIVNQPVVSQAEADTLAAARLGEISGAFIEAEGRVFRRPDVVAGQFVKIEGLGKRFSGSYLVTSALHTFSPEGLETTFHVRGTRTGLLTEQVLHRPPLNTWPGAVTAVVTNSDDPKNWGRVKVKFPWMSEEAESDWARVVGIGAGPKAGLYAIPDVNDEVLVTFLSGDFNQPVVLGGLWNGKNAVPPEAAGAASGEKPLVRTWHSRKGHWIAIFDDAQKKIELATADGRTVTLDDKNKNITLKTSSVTVILEDNQLAVEAGGDIKVKAGGNLKAEASGNVDIQAGGQVNIKGATINLN